MPTFYLDSADSFVRRGRVDLAVRALSNLAELQPSGTTLPRLMAHHLEQHGRADLAVETLELLLDKFPKDQHVKRDLALVLARRAERSPKPFNRSPLSPKVAPGLAQRVKADYARSLELLNDVVVDGEGVADNLSLIALMDANRLVESAKELGAAIPQDPRLRMPLQCDLRIVMTIISDNADVVLHVTEPSGETADRNHNTTMIGGLMSSRPAEGVDRTQEYLVRKAMQGKYRLVADVVAAREDRDRVGIVARLDVFTDFGRDNERHWTTIRHLDRKKGSASLGQIQFSSRTKRYVTK